MMDLNRICKTVTYLVLLVVVVACASDRLSNEGLKLLNEGRYEEGIAKLEEAAKARPADFHNRALVINKREEVANRLLVDATNARAGGDLSTAEAAYRRVLTIDPVNERAKAAIAALDREHEHVLLIEKARDLLNASDLDGALAELQPVISEAPKNPVMLALKREIEAQKAKESLAVPTLKSMYSKPVSLEFRDANLKVVFELLTRSSGINFVIDKEVRPDITVTISVKDTTLDNVLDLLLRTNQLGKMVLNSNTVLIYPNTQAKAREYEDLVVKGFYIENADVKQTMSMVKTLLKSRDIVADEKLNLMIMRDTPETIRLAEKLIAMLDLAEPEVMLEVEVLEVKRSRLLNLGIQFPQQLTLTPLAGTGGTLTVNDLKNLNANRIGAAIGSTTINAKQVDSNINLLANPRIRTRNREKAKIMIGDRVPVITTTSNSTGFVSDSVQYVDVGLKLEVEPTVYLQDDVAIKVGLEVSSVVNQITSQNGTLSYQIGSRNATTVLRLKDGETQVLAGLINDEDRATANKVPGLGSLPLLGRLFSSHNDDKQKTEIILSITPHIIRNLKRPDASASEFWSGSEATVRTTPLLLQKVKGASIIASSSSAPASVAAGVSSANPQGINISSVPKPDKVATAGTGQPAKILGLSWVGPQQVKSGEQFQLALNLKTDAGLRGLPFQLAYDPTALKVVDVVEGEFFKQDDAQTSFTNNLDVASGKVFVGAVRSGSDGASGEKSVAVITFKAIAANPKAVVKLLSATPVGSGEKLPNLEMPDDYKVIVTD